MVRVVRRWGYRHLGAVVALVLAIAAGPARAEGDPNLANARAAIESLDYKLARTSLAEALASGMYGPDEVSEIYLLTGVVSGGLGDRAAAVDAFRKLLSLTPKASLVAGTTPKVAKPFAEASALAKTSAPLKVASETAVTPPTITLVVESDPMKLVAGARVTVVADGAAAQTLDAKGSERIVVELPAARRLELRIAAVDQHGNRLVELGGDAPIVIAAPIVTPEVKSPVVITQPTLPPSLPPPPRPRPLYAQWWLWGGVSVAAAATGTLFGLAVRSAGNDLDALNATSMAHDFGEAQDILDRGRRNALISNIAFSAAGASAVAAVILFVTRPDSRSRERSVTVVPTPTRGGTTLTLEVPF